MQFLDGVNLSHFRNSVETLIQACAMALNAARFLSPACLLQRLTISTTTVSPTSGDKVPQFPKKPPGIFLRFLEEQRVSPAAAGLNYKKVVQMAAQKWHEAPENDKIRLQQAYLQDLEEWRQRKAAVEKKLEQDNLLEGVKARMAEEKLARALRKARLDQKRLNDELGKPKKPTNAYGLYVKEWMKVRERVVDTLRCRDKFVSPQVHVSKGPSSIKEAAAEWKGLTEGDKAHYEREANRLKEKYAKELEAWTAQLEKSGDKAEVMLKANEKLSKLQSKKRELQHKE